jgi:perosamine synthetase
MSAPDITDAEIEAVTQVLRTPHLSIGPRIAAFEERVAAYIGAKHAIGVSSGTAGLHLCVIAADVRDGDLVITTPFSFVASANVILYERAIPIFVDIDSNSLNLDVGRLREAVEALSGSGEEEDARRWLPPALRQAATWRGKLKAILAVHAFGQPADMDPIAAMAREHELSVIEDACEAIGARYKQRMAGRLGDVAVFAFYPNKQMTTGEGGVIVTDRDDWDALFRSLRNQGRDVFDEWLNHSRLGYNYRLDEMSAALGLAQMERIEELLGRRERVAGWYAERLSDVSDVQIPDAVSTTSRMSWFVYVIRLAPNIDRSTVMAALQERGIPSRPYFSPIHLQPFYRRRFDFSEGDYPVSEEVARRALALPFSSVMTEDDVGYVCENLAVVLRQSGRRGS